MSSHIFTDHNDPHATSDLQRHRTMNLLTRSFCWFLLGIKNNPSNWFFLTPCWASHTQSVRKALIQSSDMAKIEFLAACKLKEWKPCVTVLWLFNTTFKQKDHFKCIVIFHWLLTRAMTPQSVKQHPQLEKNRSGELWFTGPFETSCMVLQLRRKITELQILNAKTIILWK